MPANHRLWTGPPGAAPWDCLLTELAGEPGGLWIVPTPLARDQLSRRLCLGNSGHGPAPRVYCWSDLWRLGAARWRKVPPVSRAPRSGRFSRKRSGNFWIRAKSRQQMRPLLGSRNISAVCRSVFRPGQLRSATSQPPPSSPLSAEAKPLRGRRMSFTSAIDNCWPN